MQPEPTLAQLLGAARRWFDEALIAGLARAGAAPVSATQVGLFAVLDPDGTTVSELARRMGVTRQTAHQAVQALTRLGLLEQAPDPSSGRQRLVRRTAEGERAHRTAVGILRKAETTLARRIGRDPVHALRAALQSDWGRPPS
ncbi:MarR family winged helix-turn-helix transcriptional regulator [Amycolatopsis methanolica]|uniref:Putative MarR-family transcriptional regulator n=1 Tax=Amycolatopsis methanolica 239 TaxID=1068978 RepID=A0A076MUE9_AMYME|nr:MarR family winged helix-turn-helix transcriptional regulator [Amycolatopsis methanolica]AIJ24528.1 putative MarR-family transcriptional regulator [Amycolatopsis methanolica 239]